MQEYDAQKDAEGSYYAAIEAKRLAALASIKREVVIGDCRLILGDCLEILPALGSVNHVISDPPYEDELHNAMGRIRRNDGREMVQSLGFEGVNSSRSTIAQAIVEVSTGWALIFTLAEGVRAWRDDLQAVGAKWDTVLAWIKPDASPRFNGQGAARGFENCVTVWCGNVLGFPLGWKYDPGCCRSAAEPGGDCAPISSEYVTEGPDGWHVDLPKGAHPKLLTKGYSGVVPYGVERASPEGNYHICLSTDGAARYCFYAGARGF